MDGKSLVFITDIEHVDGIDQDVVAFCEGVDVLSHGAQYTDDEPKDKQGWGHGSFSQAMQVARSAHIDRLVVTHHDPDHDDSFLSEMEGIRRKWFDGIVFAREEMEIDW